MWHELTPLVDDQVIVDMLAILSDPPDTEEGRDAFVTFNDYAVSQCRDDAPVFESPQDAVEVPRPSPGLGSPEAFGEYCNLPERALDNESLENSMYDSPPTHWLDNGFPPVTEGAVYCEQTVNDWTTVTWVVLKDPAAHFSVIEKWVAGAQTAGYALSPLMGNVEHLRQVANGTGSGVSMQLVKDGAVYSSGIQMHGTSWARIWIQTSGR